MNLADKAAERAATFIRSIKAQTRDVKTTEGQSFNLIDIIEGVTVFLGHSLKQNKCIVNLVDSQVKVEMFGSPTKMTQVFTNLISNAIDAFVPACGTLRIDLEKTSPNLLIIKVEDNGCGIPQENLSKVFEPMYSTKSFGQGTGLGLSIVHDIIRTR